MAELKGTTLTLILKDFTITPQNVTLPKAGAYTIVIWNEGSQLHSLKIEGNGLTRRPRKLTSERRRTSRSPSRRQQVRNVLPGRRPQNLGMTGTITVG